MGARAALAPPRKSAAIGHCLRGNPNLDPFDMWPLRINPYAGRAVSIPSKSSSVGEYSSSRTTPSEANTHRVGEAVADRVGDRLFSSFVPLDWVWDGTANPYRSYSSPEIADT